MTQYPTPARIVASATMPATRPAVALASPRRSPPDARIRRSERAPLTIAKGAKMPKGSASRPSTRALVAARSLTVSAGHQSFPPPQHDVENRADAPEEADDDPQELRQPAHVLAVDDVDHRKHEGDRVQEDRQQHLDDELDHSAS